MSGLRATADVAAFVAYLQDEGLFSLADLADGEEDVRDLQADGPYSVKLIERTGAGLTFYHWEIWQTLGDDGDFEILDCGRPAFEEDPVVADAMSRWGLFLERVALLERHFEAGIAPNSTAAMVEAISRHLPGVPEIQREPLIA